MVIMALKAPSRHADNPLSHLYVDSTYSTLVLCPPSLPWQSRDATNDAVAGGESSSVYACRQR